MASLQHNMETEVRAVVHVTATFQSDGRASCASLVLFAGLHSHDCTQGTLVVERCSGSEKAQSRALGSEGSREPPVPPPKPCPNALCLEGKFGNVLTKSVTPDNVGDSQPCKVHYNSLSLSLFHDSIKTLDFSPRGKPY